MAGNPDKRIFDAIDRHFAGGLPMTEQTLMTKNAQKRVALCWKLYQMWRQNPMMDIMSCLIYTFGRTLQQAYIDKRVFDYIRSKHEDNTRETAFHKSARTSELIIERALAKGDDHLAEKALGRFNEIHHLKDEAPENRDGILVAALPIAVTTDVKHIDKERDNIIGRQLELLYKKYDGKPDALMAKYAQKKEELARRLEEEEEGNG